MIVSGTVARSVGLDSFADITPVEVSSIARDGIDFDGDLTPEQQDAVWARMTSRDDADQAMRANIADLRATAAALTATTDDVRALALAVSAYLLGGAT